MRDNGVGVIENNNDATLSTQSDLIFPAELQKWKPTTLELKGEHGFTAHETVATINDRARILHQIYLEPCMFDSRLLLFQGICAAGIVQLVLRIFCC